MAFSIHSLWSMWQQTGNDSIEFLVKSTFWHAWRPAFSQHQDQG
jgi:hypothetical protein